MSTLIHGIGASENIDTTGEIVSISGMDISSLEVDGIFNYEHKNDQPSQIVGKILRAKKIFSDADCDNEHELYFWNKCKTPYLYVMGELFDDYKDSAREVAGMFKYDADKKGQNERTVMNFSVEGVKIHKKDITVDRSIARKITITVLPANKAAIAEILPISKKQNNSEDLDLFKTENTEIEVLHLNENSKLWDLLKKEDPAKHADKLGIKPFEKDEVGLATGVSNALGGSGPSSPGGILAASEGGMKKSQTAQVGPNGINIGATQSGKPIHSHGKISEYHDFSAQDHKDAHAAHTKIAQKLGSMGRGKEAMFHQQKAKLHFSRATTMGDKAKIASSGIVKNEDMQKALTAGSGLASPDRLVGGAALAKENLQSYTSGSIPRSPRLQHAKGRHMDIVFKNESKNKKSKWFIKAEEAYEKWEKREQFRNYMKSKMPHLTKGEIDALGCTLMLHKAIQEEKNLQKAPVSEPQHSFFVKKE